MTGSAKQSILSLRGEMDCFAALAMTAECNFTFSRHDLPEVLQENLALEIRGRREDRVRAAPAVSYAIVATRVCARAYRFGGNTPAFPAQWLYGLYVIVLVTGFLATIIRKKCEPLTNLTPAPGRRTQTISPYAWATLVSRSLRVHRSLPLVRDDGQRPSGGTGWRES